MTAKKDLEFISKLSADFFKKAHIRKTLDLIARCEITGWEKWLQVEFSAYLESQKEVTFWAREYSYNLDQRVLSSRRKCAVDILIHQKKKHSHIALEIKQFNSPNSCIKSMVQDMIKIMSIRSVELYDIRSVWCLGIHRHEEVGEIRRLVAYHSDKLKLQIDSTLAVSKKIVKTAFAYTII